MKWDLRSTYLIARLTLLLTLSWAFGIAAPPAQAQQELNCDETYTVQQGDWLSKIAQKYFGDPLAYDRLVVAANANPNDEYTNIANPDLIEPGWVICIRHYID